MVMQVHDELVFEVPDDELDWARAAVPRIMAGVAPSEGAAAGRGGGGQELGRGALSRRATAPARDVAPKDRRSFVPMTGGDRTDPRPAERNLIMTPDPALDSSRACAAGLRLVRQCVVLQAQARRTARPGQGHPPRRGRARQPGEAPDRPAAGRAARRGCRHPPGNAPGGRSRRCRTSPTVVTTKLRIPDHGFEATVIGSTGFQPTQVMED